MYLKYFSAHSSIKSCPLGCGIVRFIKQKQTYQNKKLKQNSMGFERPSRYTHFKNTNGSFPG